MMVNLGTKPLEDILCSNLGLFEMIKMITGSGEAVSLFKIKLLLKDYWPTRHSKNNSSISFLRNSTYSIGKINSFLGSLFLIFSFPTEFIIL